MKMGFLVQIKIMVKVSFNGKTMEFKPRCSSEENRNASSVGRVEADFRKKKQIKGGTGLRGSRELRIK